MGSKKFITFLVTLFLLIFLVNFLAIKFYWYYFIWWFDMPMHTLGGFWSGLFLIWILSYKNFSHPTPRKLILTILFGVLLIGVAWEIFEFSANNYIVKNFFLANKLDSISDIFFDLAGGTVAILYFFKRIMFVKGNEVQLN